MTIDINLLRTDKGGNPDLVRESERKRGHNPEVVNEVIKLDEEWKKAGFDLDALNKELNAISREIGALYKEKKDPEPVKAKKLERESERETIARCKKDIEAKLREKLGSIGNIVHSDVIVSNDEANNHVVRTWSPTEDQSMATVEPAIAVRLPHHEVLRRLGGYSPERGVKVAGHRGYFLTGIGVDLAMSLANYGLSFLASRGYKKIMTPLFMKRKMMASTAQLSQFDEELYKVVTSNSAQKETKKQTEDADEDAEDDSLGTRYLIATAEQPISAYHANEWLQEDELPLRYAGYSSCFRKEAGAHGRDTWGIFRVHQFEKVEQFVLCCPEQSWEIFNEMITASEEFYQSLGVPYRIVSIVSGALNNAAAKKYDLEAWFPFQKEFKELVSCSNCTDYQSRNLEIRCGTKKQGEREKKYVHLLNSTLTAVERTICCLLESFQTETGVRVPTPLIPFIGRDFLPYVCN